MMRTCTVIRYREGIGSSPHAAIIPAVELLCLCIFVKKVFDDFAFVTTVSCERTVEVFTFVRIVDSEVNLEVFTFVRIVDSELNLEEFTLFDLLTQK